MSPRAATPPRQPRNRTASSVGSSRSVRRIRLLRFSLVAIFALLAVRLFMIQIVDHAHYARLSVGQVREDLVTTALRAGIYDRYGQILAVSRPTSLVIADDFQIAHPGTEARAMSPIVGVPVGQLTRLLSERHGYVIINNHLDLTMGRQLATMNFPGIVVQSSSIRSYPNGAEATALLGGVNASGVGSAGLEYQYQKL